MVNRKETRKAVAIFFPLIICIMLFTGCIIAPPKSCNDSPQRYWICKGYEWVSEDSQIVIDAETTHSVFLGKMTVDGVEYKIIFGMDLYASDVSFYIQGDGWDETTSAPMFGDLLWQGTAAYKNGKYTITITEDHISDYVGKKIVLEKKLKETSDENS